MCEEYYAGLHIYLIKSNVNGEAKYCFFWRALCNDLSANAGMMYHAA